MDLEISLLELKKSSSKEKAKILSNFFKTRKGEYGEGDVFIGVTIPKIREISKRYDLTIKDIKKLLKSKIHEERMLGALKLVNKFECAKKEKNQKIQKEIFKFYLKNINCFNNWDLVDLTAPKIIGYYLLENKNEKKLLFKLANTKKSKSSFEWLWKKRIAIVSTLAFIKNNDFNITLQLAEINLKEKHDLMHKATGWMLREIGKRNEKELTIFLNKYSKIMPRTMLRYSIEKFDENKRKYYLKQK